MIRIMLAALLTVATAPSLAGQDATNAGGVDVQLADSSVQPRMWVGRGDHSFHSSYDFNGDWGRWYQVKTAAGYSATWQDWDTYLTTEESAWLASLPLDEYREAIHHALSVWPGGGS